MKYCKACNAHVDTNESYCPLCYSSLKEKSKKSDNEMFKNATQDLVKRKKVTVAKVFFLISVVIIATCTYLNVQTKTAPWSVIVDLSIAYLWVLIGHTIMSRSTAFKKVLLQILSIGAILFTTNKYFSNTEWFVNYAVPSLAILFAIVMLFVVFCSKSRKEYIFGFFRLDVILLLVTVLLLVLKLDDFKLLNQINIIWQAIICLAYLLFAGKIIKTQAGRKFHL